MLDTVSKYIYAVYQNKSVCKAAKQLYVSQPALSAAIKREEERLGFQIFNRKTLPLTLTAEGRCYIDAIEKAQNIQREAMEKIDDIRHADGGTLRIGTATHISYYVIPKILKEFQKRYPKIDVHIVITNTGSLSDLLLSESVDLLFSSEPKPAEEYHEYVLLEERFVVAIPRDKVPERLLPFAMTRDEVLCAAYDESKMVSDLSLFHGVEFVYTPPQTTIQKKRKLLFGKEDLNPYITSNTQRQQLNFNLMRAGFGALLTTDMNVATMQPDDSYALFAIGGPYAKQNLSVVTKPDSTPIAEKFVDIARTIFEHPQSVRDTVKI